MENKQSYFSILLPLDSNRVGNEIYIEKLKNQLDLVFSMMKVTTTFYIFSNGSEIIVLLRSEERKRQGQLNKYCEQYFKNLNQQFYAKALYRDTFIGDLARLQQNKNFKILQKPITNTQKYWEGFRDF
jgi:predicted P-loop ATPase/GTPase